MDHHVCTVNPCAPAPYDIGVKYSDFFGCLYQVVYGLIVVIPLFGGVFV